MEKVATNSKVALVTNVQSFVGPSAVEALLNDGYQVIAYDPAFASREEIDRYKAEHPATTPLYREDTALLIEAAWAVYGQVDVLISNDSYPAIHTPVEDANIDDLNATLQSLVVWPFALMKAAIPRLKQQQGGNVIMITSCRTDLPLDGGAIPDAARAGANALVKSLSLELAPLGIPVNAIAPNYFYSEAYFPRAKFIDDPAGREYIREVVPAGRLGESSEMGELVIYLANMKGSFHTGTIINFAGGWPAAPVRPS